MSFYDIGYYISMGVAIIGAMVAIFLFFFLDIRQAIKMSSGKQRRKRIQEKAVQYSKNDTSSELTVSSMTNNPMYIKTSEELKGKKGKREKYTGQLGDEVKLEAVNLKTMQEIPQTSVTSVLRRGDAINMTTVLQEPGRNNPTIAPNRNFKITQNIIVIHTNEKI